MTQDKRHEKAARLCREIKACEGIMSIADFMIQPSTIASWRVNYYQRKVNEYHKLMAEISREYEKEFAVL